MIQFKGLIFDMDGLMVDTERLYWKCEYQLAEEAGVELSVNTLHKMMGRKPRESIQIFCNDLGLKEDPRQVLKRRDDMMLELMQQELLSLPGLLEIIKGCKAILRLAIATGAHQKFMDLVVDKLGMRQDFEVLLCSDTIKQGKPHPEIYLKACEMLQLDAQQCIVLEDTENGCRSAQQAGCHTIAVPSEYTRGQDFSMAHKVTKDLFEAKIYINELLRK